MLIRALILTSIFTVIISAQSDLYAAPAKTGSTKPKLVVAIVLDQFRADYLTRFESRFKPALDKNGNVGGFRYLMEQGAYFPQGQYSYLQCMTGPGHATILSGSYPYQSGISTNDWFDHQKGEPVYCVEDQTIATVGSTPADPHVGTSPKNYKATTVGDELKNAGFPAKVVSVALKDRAAILMGGHRPDLALWFDSKAFQWVSSKYYIPQGDLPVWVQKLNQEIAGRKGQTLTWKPDSPASGNSLTDSFVSPDDRAAKALGRDFPHTAKIGEFSALMTPYGAELTGKAAEAALDAFQLGRGKSTDLLAVSFSNHDYTGHAFGPNSREMEEVTVAEDKVISQFINAVRKKVPGGLKEVVFVLTADHGAPPNPAWLKSERVDAGKIIVKDMNDAIEKRLTDKFGKPESKTWVSFNIDLNIYLNIKEIARRDLKLSEVEEEAKKALLTLQGVRYVVTSTDYAQRKLPPGITEKQILKGYFPGRNGELLIIPHPFYMKTGDTVTHMTGYSYDRTVPIVFAGKGIKKGRYGEQADVVDIAPTLAFLLGTIPPSLSEGRVLSEILEK